MILVTQYMTVNLVTITQQQRNENKNTGLSTIKDLRQQWISKTKLGLEINKN